MDKKRWNIIIAAAGVILIILLFWYVPMEEIALAFSSFSLVELSLFLLVSLIIMVLLTLKWLIILKGMGHSVPLGKLFMYRVAGFSVSYMTPSARLGGEPVMAYFLNHNHGIAFKEGLSSVIIDRSIELVLDGLFSCVAIIIVLFTMTLPEKTVIIMVLSFVGISALIYSFYRLTATGRGFFTTCCRLLRLDKLTIVKRYEKDIEEIESQLTHFFMHNTAAFRNACILFLITWVFMFLEYKLALLLLGYNASFVALFIVIALVGIALIIPVPAALGVLEAGQSSASVLLKVSSGIGLALSIVIRGRDILWTIIGLAYLTLHKLSVQRFMDGGQGVEQQ